MEQIKSKTHLTQITIKPQATTDEFEREKDEEGKEEERKEREQLEAKWLKWKEEKKGKRSDSLSKTDTASV